MADKRNRNWAYTSLAGEDSVVLEIDGELRLPVAQYTGSFAINQVPQALCGVAIGRYVDDPAVSSSIHNIAKSLRQMRPAKVFFKPSGDYTTDGKNSWPEGEEICIFDGYYTGYGTQKAMGKVYFVCHLTHWLADLSFSSSLSSISHARNPVDLTFPAVMAPLTTGGGTGGTPNFVSDLVGHSLVEPALESDLWGAIKGLMCAMSTKEGFKPVADTGQLEAAKVNLKTNDRANRALKRIEGGGNGSTGESTLGEGSGSSDCSMDYKYGKELPLKVALTQVYSGIARAINGIMTYDAAGATLWDLLIGRYCPMFGLDVLPAVDRAVVAASLPGYRGEGDDHDGRKHWRTLSANEYDFVDDEATLDKPLRAVVVHGSVAMEGGSNISGVVSSGNSFLAGVFGSSTDGDADGVIMYTPLPSWIANISVCSTNAGASTGCANNKATGSTTNPSGDKQGEQPPEKLPGELFESMRELLNKFAQNIFVQNTLRGRSGTVVGKLRFDIGPGSHLRLEGSPEQFIGGEDELAATRFCQVNRVTVDINCEARRAGTSIVVTHVRNEAENDEDRTSADEHPFYGRNVCLGLPLVPELEFEKANT